MKPFQIIPFEIEQLDAALAFERELRVQEPDTYFWEPDAAYREALARSFTDGRFQNAVSLLAVRDSRVIGRIDAVILAGRSDPACASAYLDWLCVLKSERHGGVAQALLDALRRELRARGVSLLVALMAQNGEAQRFYRAVEDASIHDEGIWMEV